MSPVRATASAEPRFRGHEVLLYLALFGLLISLRLPLAWKEGRFQDEEATVFLAYAWNFPWQEALLRSFGGYLNIAANATTVALAAAIKAGWVPLVQAPYVTMLLGLLFQLAPLALLLTGSAPWLSSRAVRIVAAALVILPPATEEVYLNVMHIQFHLALCVAIILTLDPPRSRLARSLYAACLFVAPLCGPGAIVFLPLFALRFVLERDGARARQLAWLGAGAAIQLLFFYSASPVRGSPAELDVLAAGLFVRLLALPLAGELPAVILGLEAAAAHAAGGALVGVLAGVAVVIFGALLWWAGRRRDGVSWLVVSALLVATVSLGLGTATRPEDAARAILMGLAGPRYNFLPLVLLGLSILALAVRRQGTEKRIAQILVVILLFVGATNYRLSLLDYSTGPSWRKEVAAYEADRNHPLAVWPRPHVADLSGRARACPETFPIGGDPDDPRYCESGWVSAFYPAKAN